MRSAVVVLVMDKSEIAHYQGLVAELRAAGIRSELYLGAAGMNAQLKYADRRGAVCAVIQGSNEREKGEIAIRDLVLGAQLAASTKDRDDYLELRDKEGFKVVGSVSGAAMAGWEYDGPFDELPAQAHPAGYPAELAEVVRRQNWAPAVAAKEAHRVVAWKEVGATTGTSRRLSVGVRSVV